MLFHSSSCYLAPIRMCLHFKHCGGKIINKPRVQPGPLASSEMWLKASPESTFCRASNCLPVLLIQSPRGYSCPGHCFILFFNINLINLFWPCCGMRNLSLWHMDSISGSQAPEHVGSVVATCGLSCSTACGILVPPFISSHSIMFDSLWPQPGIKLMSPAWQGGSLAIGPPGKSLGTVFLTKWTDVLKIRISAGNNLDFQYFLKNLMI